MYLEALTSLFFSLVPYTAPIQKPLNVPLVVGVIDSGLQPGIDSGICSVGHYDFTGNGLEDVHGHGTNVSGLIHKEAQDSDYCQVILKYYHDKTQLGLTNMWNSTDAFIRAVKMKVNIINYSSYGKTAFEKERRWIIRALNQGIKIVTVAGNEPLDLDKTCHVFPACYDPRIIVIGQKKLDGVKYGGRGKIVDYYIDGFEQEAYGITLSGTSQAAARYTGLLVKDLSENAKNRR